MNPDTRQPRPTYDLIRDSDWSQHPVLRMLQRGTDVWPNEWHFYFAGFSPAQTRNLRSIQMASAPEGSLHFTVVEQVTGASDALFEEVANVRWYLGDPEGGPRQWVALVPRGFDLDADVRSSPVQAPTAQAITDFIAGTLSDDDRRSFLRYQGYEDDEVNLALGSLKWTDAAILDGIAALTRRSPGVDPALTRR